MGFEIDPARVRAVVFDLGGVFIAGGPKNVAAFGASLGLPPGGWEAIARELFLSGDDWSRVERGQGTLDEFARTLIAKVAARGGGLTLEEARGFMDTPENPDAYPIRQPVVQACQRLHQRLPTALLTNNIAEWRAAWRSALDVEALFDLVVDSSEVGVRKPEEAIYRLVEQGLGLPGADLLFVDDLGVNLKTAHRLGWQTLKYEETAAVLAVLDQVAAGRPLRK